MAKSSRPVSSIKMCNFKSFRCSKLKKMAQNLIFGYLDHSIRHFLRFLNDPGWLIRQPNSAHHQVISKYAISSRSYVPNSRKQPKTIWIIQKGRNAYTRRTDFFLKNEPDFSRTCGFRGEFTESLNFQNIPFKSTNQWQTFRQNRVKVKKGLFFTHFRNYWMIQIFFRKSGFVTFLDS